MSITTAWGIGGISCGPESTEKYEAKAVPAVAELVVPLSQRPLVATKEGTHTAVSLWEQKSRLLFHLDGVWKIKEIKCGEREPIQYGTIKAGHQPAQTDAGYYRRRTSASAASTDEIWGRSPHPWPGKVNYRLAAIMLGGCGRRD